MKTQRFKCIHKEGTELRDEGVRMVLVDTETGVNYLIWKSGYAGGITPLLDSSGKPVISPKDMEL